MKKIIKRIFVCQIVPNDQVLNLPVHQSANNFCFKLIKAIEPLVINILNIRIKQNISLDFSNDLPKIEIETISKRINNEIFILKVISNIMESLAILNIARRNKIPIWLYNIELSNCLIFILLKIFRLPVFLIILDYESPASIFSKWYFFKFLIKKSNGIIGLSESVLNEFNIKNSIIKYGICHEKSIRKNTFNRIQILYSGYLDSDIFGIELALETIQKMPEFDLIITGRGRMVPKIIELAKIHSNIKYLGFQSYDEYTKLLSNIDICLSLRNPTYVCNEFNFPSKICEFLENQKIVISTRKYPKLSDDIYFYSNYNSYDLREVILNISKMNIEEYISYKKRISSFVSNEFSFESWNWAMEEIERFNFKPNLIK